ncbi:hypothetical protein KQI65_00885 [bacterium]|nr:hypothetical protein [bacterium]
MPMNVQMRLILPMLVLVLLTGCAPQFSLTDPASMGPSPRMSQQMREMPGGVQDVPNGLQVRTHDNSTMLFRGDQWQLTPSGIRGTAEVRTEAGDSFTTDTTLSYWDAAEAAPAGRQGTMSQFMLTILGVILILGLAAIILYAAFLATDR